jgi:hypothetical protein
MSIEYTHNFLTWLHSEQLSENLSVSLVFERIRCCGTKNYKFIFKQNSLEISVYPGYIDDWIAISCRLYPPSIPQFQSQPSLTISKLSAEYWLIRKSYDDDSVRFKIIVSDTEFETFKELYTSKFKPMTSKTLV